MSSPLLSYKGCRSSGTLFAKTFGLVAVQAAGLSLGSEGPFVRRGGGGQLLLLSPISMMFSCQIHIAGCVAVALCTYLPQAWFYRSDSAVNL